MKEKTIYNLELHEVLKVSNTMHITRLSGGWLYSTGANATFVPFSSEFQMTEQLKNK